MNGYDFDKTIYNGDCFIDFYFYVLWHRFYLIILLPFQLVFILFTFYSMKWLKQMFACYLIFTYDKDILIKNFWTENIGKIKDWYIDQKQEDDIIISASPTFLIEEACRRLGIKYYIATNMSLKTGIIHGKNCRGKEKVRAYRKIYKDELLKSYYGDSKSDFAMQDVSEKIYLVKKNKISLVQ